MSDDPAGAVDPLELVALIATRLCHDMAGPVGAVSNGAELMGGDPAMVDAEALELLSSSAAGAAVKLRTLRGAFGMAGAVEPGDLPRQLAAWAGPRCAIALPERDRLAALGPERLRLLLNLCLVALDATVAPAALSVTLDEDGEGLRLATRAAGRGGRVDPDLPAVMAGATAGLGPRTVQAWLAGGMARRLGGRILFESEASGSAVAAILPRD